MYGDKWMKGWVSKAEKPGYEECLFVAWVWGVEKIFGKLFGKAVMEVCVQKVGGGMNKVPVFKERKGGCGFGEFVPEAVLSSVPIPNQPTSQLRRATNEKKNYDIIEAILNHRAQLLTHIKLVFTALFNRYRPLLPPPSRSSSALPYLLTLAATPLYSSACIANSRN